MADENVRDKDRLLDGQRPTSMDLPDAEQRAKLSRSLSRWMLATRAHMRGIIRRSLA